ncbi:TolC family protein [Flavobacteriaceae bacterium F89]|uniref:TolC family protein n=1 Tax=Cerina litoralis TaxID=2874477 RepID=A0AAE3JQL3_9FLAO|nr:TolC family protein [Cerina litoralis]MCG2460378.1 TolC family protein [Cerina litoralis]
MKHLVFWVLITISLASLHAQDHTLEYFIARSERNFPNLKNNKNLQKIGEIQRRVILAQHSAFHISASSEVLVAPYFNNNGQFMDISTNPSPDAYGYDVGITNGGLYSAQLNIAKNIFNGNRVDNLLFQNRLKNDSLDLSYKEILHQLNKNVTDTYIMAYQLQSLEDFTKKMKMDLEKRMKVIALLVKKGLLSESDYLLVQLNVDSKTSEIRQIHTDFKATMTQLYNLCGIPTEPEKRLATPEMEYQTDASEFFYQKRFKNDSLQVMANRQIFENQYKPIVGIYGNTGLNAVTLNNLPHYFGLSAGLRLTIPIYDGNQRKYNALQSKLKYESLEEYRKNSKIQLDNNLENILAQIQSLEENLGLLETQLNNQQKILEIFKGKLVYGQVSIIDYLNVLQNYKLRVYTQLQMQTNLWLLQNQYNFVNW